MQFGFKGSTNMCSVVLKKVVSYYVQHQSPAFCTFLDATKAFGRIKYCKLFKLRLQCHLPAPIIRVLVNLYTNSLVHVSWCGAVSDYFVAGPAVLSPVLFCVYIDDLVLLLSEVGVGCFIGSNFVGALAYADVIVLIVPTAKTLRKLLILCDE